MAVKVTVTNAVAGVVTSRPRIAVSVIAPQSIVDAVLLSAGSSAAVAAAGVQYTLPATQVAYIVLNSAAEVDTSGRYRLVPETLVTIDGTRLAVGTTKRDAFAVSDSSTFFFAKGLKETLSFVEVVTRTLMYIRTFNDSFSLADATSFVLSQLLAESVAPTDAATRASTKLLRDAPTLAELVRKTSTKPFADTVGTVDTQARTTSKRSVDSLALADIALRSVQKLTADSVAASDAATRTVSRLLKDGFALNDLADVGDGLSVSFAAGISNVAFASDASRIAMTMPRADSVGTTESGSLVSQSYCDITYFADDYVGASRTFS